MKGDRFLEFARNLPAPPTGLLATTGKYITCGECGTRFVTRDKDSSGWITCSDCKKAERERNFPKTWPVDE